MRRFGLLTVSLLCTQVASAQTMLEQAKMRGAAAAQQFEDDPSNALPQVPWSVETYTSNLLGIDVGLARLGSASIHERNVGGAVAGQLRHSKLEQPRWVGLWGQSWALALDTEFGAQSNGYFGWGAAMAQFGTLATLSSSGHALFFRFSGEISGYRDKSYSMGTGFVSIPFGLRFKVGDGALEVGAVPALGWVSLFQGTRQFAAGPLFFGAGAKWQTRAGWVEAQHLRGVSPAEVAQSTLLACGHSEHVAFCVEGNWLDVHDLGQGDEAKFARIGLRIGLGDWTVENKKSFRTAVVQLQ